MLEVKEIILDKQLALDFISLIKPSINEAGKLSEEPISIFNFAFLQQNRLILYRIFRNLIFGHMMIIWNNNLNFMLYLS